MNTTHLLLILGISVVLLLIVFMLFMISAMKTQRRNALEAGLQYDKKPFMTASELAFYKILLPIASAKSYLVFSKVNLPDVVMPMKGPAGPKIAYERIRPLYIDFVLFDKDQLMPVLAIDLQDQPMAAPSGAVPLNFVDISLKSANIPLLRLRDGQDLESRLEEFL